MDEASTFKRAASSSACSDNEDPAQKRPRRVATESLLLPDTDHQTISKLEDSVAALHACLESALLRASILAARLSGPRAAASSPELPMLASSNSQSTNLACCGDRVAADSAGCPRRVPFGEEDGHCAGAAERDEEERALWIPADASQEGGREEEDQEAAFIPAIARPLPQEEDSAVLEDQHGDDTDLLGEQEEREGEEDGSEAGSSCEAEEQRSERDMEEESDHQPQQPPQLQQGQPQERRRPPHAEPPPPARGGCPPPRTPPLPSPSPPPLACAGAGGGGGADDVIVLDSDDDSPPAVAPRRPPPAPAGAHAKREGDERGSGGGDGGAGGDEEDLVLVPHARTRTPRKYAHAHTCAHMHTRMHTHARTHTYAHARAHTSQKYVRTRTYT
jgi:hypothetical protein